MRLLTILVPTLLFAIHLSPTVQAAQITVTPSVAELQIAEELRIDLDISQLGDGVSPSISIFDIGLSFDPSVFSFTGVTFSDQLDLFGLGSTQIVDDGLLGSVNLFELSFDFSSDLDLLQLSSFTLASLNFDAISVGNSGFTASVNSLGDSLGDALTADITNASVRVTPSAASVPAPSSLALFVFGLAALRSARSFTVWPPD